MDSESVVAAAGLTFLLVNGGLLVRSVHRGRKLCRLLAERLPERSADPESPLPGYFDSSRRRAYFRFINRRGFADLGDDQLVMAFARLRREELRHQVFLLAGFAGLGIAMIWLRWFHPA